MSLITGRIDRSGGAIVTVLVGVSAVRRSRLVAAQFKVPGEIALRLQIDTGSFATGFPTSVLHAPGISPYRVIPVSTTSTKPGEPHLVDQYEISLGLVSDMTCFSLPSVRAIASDDFGYRDGVQGILGREVLDRCVFQYCGPDSAFSLAFPD